MANAGTPSKWPYRAAKPGRSRRVIKTRDAAAPRGVHRPAPPEPRFRITRKQARLALAVAVLAMVVSAGWWGYHAPWVTVQKVTISGTSQVSPQQVREAAGLDGASVFGLDMRGARERVAALPMVREATVRNDGWNSVAIDVQERTAWGSWQMNGVNVPIDADGHVLAGAPAPDGSPAIIEVGAQRVLNAGERIDPGAVELAARLVKESQSAFGRTVLALVYRQDNGLTAVLSGSNVDGTPIWATFGDARDYDFKVAALYVLIQQAQQEDLALNAVDLRFGDRLSFR